AIAANNHVPPTLFAPAAFQNGSSYSHLDENTYPPGDLNSLMTPAIGFAEVIHTPGPIVLGMFTDMGWGNQTGGSCSFGLDHYTADVPASGGAVSVELVTAGGCSWTASTAAAFVSGLSPTSGMTSARIQMNVAANPSSSARAATVTIGTENFTIAQQGTSPCNNSLAPTSATVSAAGQAGTITLTSAAGCAWTASSSDTTVATITTDPLSGQGSATIGYSVSGNTGPSLRAATLTIAGLSFSITQAACGYALDNTNFTVSGAANTVTVNVSTAATCQWSASSSASFISIVSAANTTGPGGVRFSIAANPTGSARAGNVTVAGQTVTIAQGPGMPSMAIDKGVLVFGATRDASAFGAQTSAQIVRLTQAGPSGTVTWTASSNQPWLTVSPASGTGTATLAVAVQFDAGLPANGSVGGQITIVLSGAGDTVGPVNVTLNLIPPSQTAPPFGSFDTPSAGASGLAGSIAVTGWTLDDVMVARLTICREQVSGEAFGPDPRCGGFPKVYLGDGVFIDGARPDVENAFVGFPVNTRAGWGYLLLTNFLPNGGNGTFVLYAYASDVEGHTTQLGTKPITCDNAHAVAPFGAIDTPGQGALANGAVANYGWVLSPGARRSDPPGGGTVTVFVDGAPLGSPGWWTSRSDLSELFPVSQYSGVDTALGVFSLDTTAFANGIHSIAWSVTDNLGVTSGIGSRFFTVSNGTLVLSATRVADVQSPHLSDTSPGAATATVLLGRRGFDLTVPLEYYFPDRNGVVTIDAQELDRIELQLEPGATGALITPLGERPLPIGAQIDQSTGIFTWAPGAGFVGTYDFVVDGQRVRIVLRPRNGARSFPLVKDELVLFGETSIDEEAKGDHRGDGGDIHDAVHADPSEGLSLS
ncbi:MAG TPA: BACON domain-containing carbohydrate-binding protein, partial [Vicinamibacterales bacterium]